MYICPWLDLKTAPSSPLACDVTKTSSCSSSGFLRTLFASVRVSTRPRCHSNGKKNETKEVFFFQAQEFVLFERIKNKNWKSNFSLGFCTGSQTQEPPWAAKSWAKSRSASRASMASKKAAGEPRSPSTNPTPEVIFYSYLPNFLLFFFSIFSSCGICIHDLCENVYNNWLLPEQSMAAEFPRDFLGILLPEQPNKYYFIIRGQRIVLEADSSIQTLMEKLQSYKTRVALHFDVQRFSICFVLFRFFFFFFVFFFFLCVCVCLMAYWDICVWLMCRAFSTNWVTFSWEWEKLFLLTPRIWEG